MKTKYLFQSLQLITKKMITINPPIKFHKTLSLKKTIINLLTSKITEITPTILNPKVTSHQCRH